MPQRGEIVVERLTGHKVIVIHVDSPEEVTCRFADGRLEDRFVFELEPVGSGLLSPLFGLFSAPFGNRSRENSPPTVGARIRPLLARQSGS